MRGMNVLFGLDDSRCQPRSTLHTQQATKGSSLCRVCAPPVRGKEEFHVPSSPLLCAALRRRPALPNDFFRGLESCRGSDAGRQQLFHFHTLVDFILKETKRRRVK